MYSYKKDKKNGKHRKGFQSSSMNKPKTREIEENSAVESKYWISASKPLIVDTLYQNPLT